MLTKQGYTVFSSEEKQACIVFKENVGDSLYEDNANKRLNLPKGRLAIEHYPQKNEEDGNRNRIV